MVNPSLNLAQPLFRVGVDNVIFSVDPQGNRLLVLLTQRPETPGQWSLPGTLVRSGESLESAAQRILAEKIIAQNLYLEQLYTLCPDGDRPRYLSISYFALLRFDHTQLRPAEQSPSAWHPLPHLPPLAFNHGDLLQYGYQRLRNKLEYSPIAFDVLPPVFTLNEVYQLYSTILGEHFADYSNFRSRLLKLGILADTGEKVCRGAGRPAGLYRFDAQAFAPLKDKPMVFI